MSNRKEELEFLADRLGESEYPEARFYLELDLPPNLDHAQADALGHQIMAETAERHPGAATGGGSLHREWLRSVSVPLTRRPWNRDTKSTDHRAP